MVETIIPTVLTTLFVLLAGFYLFQLKDTNLFHRIAELLHAVMSLVMALMWWPVWMTLPVEPQLAVFGAGLLWYLFAAAALLLRRVSLEQLGRHRIPELLAHAAMFAAMVWMIWAMAPGVTENAALSAVGWVLSAALVCALVVFTVRFLRPAAGYKPDTTANVRGQLSGRAADFLAAAAMLLGMLAMMIPMLLCGYHYHHGHDHASHDQIHHPPDDPGHEQHDHDQHH